MESAIRALRARQFHTLSLTVTTSNTPAVRLYEGFGFETVTTYRYMRLAAAPGM